MENLELITEDMKIRDIKESFRNFRTHLRIVRDIGKMDDSTGKEFNNFICKLDTIEELSFKEILKLKENCIKFINEREGTIPFSGKIAQEESFNVQEINAFLFIVLEEDHGDLIINGEYFKLLGYETIEENSLRIFVRDEHEQEYYIYIEEVIGVVGNRNKLHIEQNDRQGVDMYRI
ncbi:hypothetical protein ACFO6R_06300 [Eubacterium multiforme]|uniref:Uncharacterized protein n=1 Tax=Eubacterium multiforme TaxID=83339 RepID=A0ABT9USB3_9FIRM|nr:hypothetical protein [Eubacterium multiforme]MDQ0149203.1 hypothetical protein [Eubacterium multiforme]